jgi:co-chaperonin GroES (HSP10)
MAFKVMGKRVLVRPIERPRTTESGIELTDRIPATYGVVEQIGTNYFCEECRGPMPIEVRVNAVVGWNAIDGQDVLVDGDTRVILNVEDLLFEWTPDAAMQEGT